jgi:hypothetical protein
VSISCKNPIDAHPNPIIVILLSLLDILFGYFTMR